MAASDILLLDLLLSDQVVERQEAIQRLIALGEHSLPCLIGALEMKEYQAAWPEIIKLIMKLRDNPKNINVIPVLLRFLKDANDSIYGLAFESLLQMGDNVVYAAHDILAYCWSDDSWVQNTCTLLKRIDSAHLDILLPQLLHLLEVGSDDNCLDEYAMGLLRKIGTPKADAAIPLLAKIVISQRNEDVRLLSIEVLSRLDLQSSEEIISALQSVLVDPSMRIRDAAQRAIDQIKDRRI
jgi:HEAT repeat protein